MNDDGGDVAIVSVARGQRGGGAAVGDGASHASMNAGRGDPGADGRPPDPAARMAVTLRALVAARARRTAAERAEQRLEGALRRAMIEQGVSLCWDVESAAQATLTRAPEIWHDFGRVPDRWWLWARQVPGLLRVDEDVLDRLAPGHDGVRALRQGIVSGPGTARLVVEEWPVARRGARR